MKKSLLYGIFLVTIGLSILISNISFKEESYAYKEKETYPVTFIYKSNDQEKENGTFQILNENEKVITSFKLEFNSKIEITTLQDERYILRQLKSPDQYNNIEDFYFSPKYDKEVILLTEISTLPKVAIILHDLNTNKVLIGAEFHLIDGDNNLINSCTTRSGYCYMNDIPKGIYYLENVIPAEGYTRLLTEKIKVDSSITIPLYTSPNSITVKYYDQNYEINGGIFRLYDQNYNYLYKLDNSHEINNLKSGVYYLEEVRPPIGYQKNTESISFEVTDDTSNINLNIYYNKLEVNDQISKMIYVIGCVALILGSLSFIIYIKGIKKA